MGRKAVPDEDRRFIRVETTVTPGEHREIVAAAEQSGTNVGRFVYLLIGRAMRGWRKQASAKTPAKKPVTRTRKSPGAK